MLGSIPNWKSELLSLLDDIRSKAAGEVETALYDFFWMSGYLGAVVRTHFDAQQSEVQNIAPVSPEKKFHDGLTRLLRKKLAEMSDLNIEANLLDRIADEFSQFFTCCLNSNRTPEELIDGLRSDQEMRDEVVALLVSRIGPTETKDERSFLNRMLSGDEDLMRLLVDNRGSLVVLKAPWSLAL